MRRSSDFAIALVVVSTVLDARSSLGYFFPDLDVSEHIARETDQLDEEAAA